MEGKTTVTIIRHNPDTDNTIIEEIMSNKYPNNSMLKGREICVNALSTEKTLPCTSCGILIIDQLDINILHTVIANPNRNT